MKSLQTFGRDVRVEVLRLRRIVDLYVQGKLRRICCACLSLHVSPRGTRLHVFFSTSDVLFVGALGNHRCTHDRARTTTPGAVQRRVDRSFRVCCGIGNATSRSHALEETKRYEVYISLSRARAPAGSSPPASSSASRLTASWLNAVQVHFFHFLVGHFFHFLVGDQTFPHAQKRKGPARRRCVVCAIHQGARIS